MPTRNYTNYFVHDTRNALVPALIQCDRPNPDMVLIKNALLRVLKLTDELVKEEDEEV